MVWWLNVCIDRGAEGGLGERDHEASRLIVVRATQPTKSATAGEYKSYLRPVMILAWEE